MTHGQRIEEPHEAAGIHRSSRCCGGMAPGGERAAAGNAGDRVSQRCMPGLWAGRVRAFGEGLSETGYVEGRNVTIEYRWAEGQYDRLPALAADLIRRRVTVITANNPAARIVKAATATIPIVFTTGGDPVSRGSCRKPESARRQRHGRDPLNAEVAPKRLELLHEVVPTAAIGLSRQPDQSQCRDRVERPAGGRPYAGAAAPDSACKHRARHRNGLCNLVPTASPRARDRHRCILFQPQRAARRTDAPPRAARDLAVSRVRRRRRPHELRRQL